MRTTALCLAAALAAATPAAAETQLQRSVAQDLREFGFGDVDVTRLSISQLAAIHHIANQSGSHGKKRGLIRSALGGRNSLRGLLGLN